MCIGIKIEFYFHLKKKLEHGFTCFNSLVICLSLLFSIFCSEQIGNRLNYENGTKSYSCCVDAQSMGSGFRWKPLTDIAINHRGSRNGRYISNRTRIGNHVSFFYSHPFNFELCNHNKNRRDENLFSMICCSQTACRLISKRY